MFKEFAEFLKRGSLIDMAIGIAVGTAFATIAKSLVDDIIMPPVGLALGNVEFGDLFLLLRQGDPAGPYSTLAAAREAGAVTIAYGNFVNNVLAFLVIALVFFMILRSLNRLRRAEPRAGGRGTNPAVPVLHHDHRAACDEVSRLYLATGSRRPLAAHRRQP